MPKSYLLNVSKLAIAVLVLSFFPLGITFAADITPPITTATMIPSTPDGENDWYVTPVSTKLSATDLESGVEEINYKLDSAPWQKVNFTDTLNRAPNPSFEFEDLNSNLNTQGWQKSSPGNAAHFERDSSAYAPGYANYSIKISSTAEGGWHEISNMDNFAVAPPLTNMNASVWFRTGSADSAYFKIFAVNQDADGNKTYTQIGQSPVLTGTHDWIKVSQSFVLSSDSAVGVYLEIGLEGSGNIWVDAVSINTSVIETTATVSVGTDGQHSLQFYAVDREGNTESTQTLTFKIDQTPPNNWHGSGAIRALQGSDHELYVYTNVEDPTSGLSTLTDKYKYHTKLFSGFGYFSDLIKCNSTWNADGWTSLASPPFSDGAHTAYLITPKTDFCDDDWKICKTVDFYAKDMAGNETNKEYCINGPWIRVSGGGIVRANAGINMISEALDYNTDGLVEVGNYLISFFTSSRGWKVENYPAPTDYKYNKFSTNLKNKTNLGTTLPTTDGVFIVNGNLTVDSSKIPSKYNEKIFNAVVFVNGTLTIDADIIINKSSTLLFIVKSDSKIKKDVADVHCGIFSDGNLFTAYDILEGDVAPTLILKGVYAANTIKLQRTLQGTNNANTPAEDITYEPKYITKIRSQLGINTIIWLSNN